MRQVHLQQLEEKKNKQTIKATKEGQNAQSKYHLNSSVFYHKTI